MPRPHASLEQRSAELGAVEHHLIDAAPPPTSTRCFKFLIMGNIRRGGL